MRKQRGITLIALVVTIIVLLILAGVSISMVVGNNGILTQASSSVVETRKANAKEEVELAWSSVDAEYWDAWTNNSSVGRREYFTKENLQKYLVGKGEVKEISYDESTGTYRVTYKSATDNETYTITVDSSGKATVAGNGIVSEPVTPTQLTLASQIDESNYGDYVNYEVDLGIATAGNELSDSSVPKTDWRIFYKDATNVYLIASDYLPNSKYPSEVFGGTYGSYNGYWNNNIASGEVTTNTNFLFTQLSNVGTTNKNYQAVSTLLDTSKWSAFAKTGYVDNVNTAAIGSPTVEMWMASWNEKYSDTLAFDANEIGYQVGLTADSLSTYIYSLDMQAKDDWSNTLYYPHANSDYAEDSCWNGCFGYWLASPSAYSQREVLYVAYDGGMSDVDYLDGCSIEHFGVRPVVSLKSGITASKDINDIWQLGE